MAAAAAAIGDWKKPDAVVVKRTVSALRAAAPTMAVQLGGATAASRAMGGAVSPKFFRYWTNKAQDPNFNAGMSAARRALHRMRRDAF